MPACLVRAYVRMLPRLSDEESVTVAEQIGVGIGLMQSADGAKSAIAKWQRRAEPPPPVLPERRVRFGAGIQFARVPVDAPSGDA